MSHSQICFVTHAERMDLGIDTYRLSLEVQDPKQGARFMLQTGPCLAHQEMHEFVKCSKKFS